MVFILFPRDSLKTVYDVLDVILEGIHSKQEVSPLAAGFGRHGMPPRTSNDTGTALGQDGSDWSRDLATLTFDLGGNGACGWCRSSSSIRVPGLKFVGLAIRKIWRTMCVSINRPGDLDQLLPNYYLQILFKSVKI